MATGCIAVGPRARILSRRLGWPTTYEIQIQLPGVGPKIINRRYNDFVRLREELLQFMDSTETLPGLPPKAQVGLLFTSSRDSRQEGLEYFLVEALSTYRADSEPWRTFLETTAGEVEALAEAAPELDHITATSNANSTSLSTVSSVVALEATTSSEPRSEMDEIREMRRQRFLQQREATTPELPVQVPSSASLLVHPGTEELSRVGLLPLEEIPSDIDSEEMRHAAVKDNLQWLIEQRTIVEAGMVLTTSMGFKFVVIKCVPESGYVSARTLNYVSGPVLPVLRRVEFVGLREHRRGQRDDASRRQLLNDHITPHFSSVFAAARVGVVSLNDVQQFCGAQFEVSALDPDWMGWGLVDSRTKIDVRLHSVPEFAQIHVVPFSDTLPSAYQFNVFEDYVNPYFKGRRAESFQEGHTFSQNGVQFKIVATEPGGLASCRVGASTMIYTEGVLHPSASELLSPEQQRQLAMLPPPLQMLALQTTIFGDGEIAERIMEAQSRQSERSRGITSSALDSMTEEVTWSQELRSQLNVEQKECVVCVQEFQDGDRVRLLPCKHVFHTACVDEWLGREPHCPLCRSSLRSSCARGARR